MNHFKTEQEEFWAGQFGNDYISRNSSQDYLASNVHFFSKALNGVKRPASIIEFGANVGMNLRAVKQLYPAIDMHAIEINAKAVSKLQEVVPKQNIISDSMLNVELSRTFDVALIKGVLIHINPEELKTVYQKLFQASAKYILVCEYYNPSPVTIGYRGHDNKLFKRDFAGEMLDLFPGLSLVDYGFAYRRDPDFPQDDITWFLLQKD